VLNIKIVNLFHIFRLLMKSMKKIQGLNVLLMANGMLLSDNNLT